MCRIAFDVIRVLYDLSSKVYCPSCGARASKITIRPKLREKSTLAFLTQDQRLLLSFGSLNVLPLVLIAFGLSIWSLRRSK